MDFDGVLERAVSLEGPCEPHSVGPSAQTSKKAGSNHAGGGTPAHFLRSARPAEAAIAKVFAKVFAKIRQKIYFANFSDAPDAWGHRGLPVFKILALNDPWRYQKR